MATGKQGGSGDDRETGGASRNAGTQQSGTQNNEGPFRDPDEWKTGDEPMTASQRSYLQTLATEAGVEVEDDLTKAEAAKRIEELQERTGRGPAKH